MIALLISVFLQVQVGNATVFGTAGDRWAGGPAACATVDHATGRKIHRPIGWHRRHGTLGIAHRTLKCGTRVRITSLATGRQVIATVVDRGPYGACVAPGWRPRVRRCPRGAWRLKKRRGEPGTWRGIADLLPATGRALGHRTGVHRIRLEVLR